MSSGRSKRKYKQSLVCRRRCRRHRCLGSIALLAALARGLTDPEESWPSVVVGVAIDAIVAAEAPYLIDLQLPPTALCGIRRRRRRRYQSALQTSAGTFVGSER